MSVTENAKDVDVWIRGLFIVIFGVIFYFLYGIIWLLVVLQFFTKVFTRQLNPQLMGFSHKLTGYALQILSYITFQSEVRPFPFSPLPEDKDDSAIREAVAALEEDINVDGD